MGGVVRGLVQPPAPPQRDQIRDAPPAPQWSSQGNLPAASGGLRGRPPCQSNSLERCHPLLESAGRSVDKQATGRARSAPGATLNPGRLNGSQGVTTFLKVTAAVTGHTKEDPIDKNTCVRLTYKASYHIDLPIYHVKSNGVPRLAHKEKGWIESDPREFISWFSSKCKDNSQLRRLVRYLKAWSDFKKGELPSGLIMSILAAENYRPDARDDVSLQLTLAAIQETLKHDFKCMRPTAPANEDLLAHFSKTKQEYFLSSLNSLVNAATYSISDAVKHKDACRRWQVYFGADRFPFEDEEVIDERFTVRIDPSITFEIDCLVTQKGFMDKLLSAILRDRSWLMPERKLKFYIKKPPAISSYDIYWKIRNVGREAIKRKQVRGQIHRDSGCSSRIEHTSFRGKHYVECYIVHNNICVAKRAILVPIMNAPS